jgi:UDP:flavonoid glycosyltransferase YjiC (YdhE family)
MAAVRALFTGLESAIMRVLVVCIPQAGHLTPLLPVASAFAAQGDEVVVASGPEVGETVTAAGLRFAPVGSGSAQWFPALAKRIRGIPGDGLPGGRILHYFVPRLFGEIAVTDMIEDVLTTARALDPHIVIYDPMAFAGPLTAAVLSAPAVCHETGPALAMDIAELATDALSPLWRTFSLNIRDAHPETTIAICPPILQSPKPGALTMRPTPLPTSPTQPCQPPLIYLTLGTFSNTNLSVFRTVLDALATQPLELIATIGTDNDPETLRPWPANARIERYIPQSELLPRCSAVINHGGSGTMLGALTHGLPQLVLPQSADNFINAEMIEQSGLGQRLLPEQATPDAIARAVANVLAHSGPARQAASQIAQMSTPSDIVELLHKRQGETRGW